MVIRKLLGVEPGSVIEWEEGSREGTVTVKKASEYTLEDLNKKVFPDGAPKPISVDEMDEAIKIYIRKKHARR